MEKKNGPLGGWELLKKAEKDGVKAYFYRDVSEAVPTYIAVLTNAQLSRIDDTIMCLELITRGLSEEQFLAILGTTRAVEKIVLQ